MKRYVARRGAEPSRRSSLTPPAGLAVPPHRATARHLAEEGPGFDNRQLQPFAGGRQAIELDAPAFEQEQHLGAVLLRVEDLALAAGAHLGLLFEGGHRGRLQVAEDVHGEHALLWWESRPRLPPGLRSSLREEREAMSS